MLVLTRKLDEAIRIGDEIKITVIRVKGNTVRIGIEAPRNVRVVRDELDRLPAAAADSVPEDDSQVFLGKVKVSDSKSNRVSGVLSQVNAGDVCDDPESESDQAAPLRAFLRNRDFQAAG